MREQMKEGWLPDAVAIAILEKSTFAFQLANSLTAAGAVI